MLQQRKKIEALRISGRVPCKVARRDIRFDARRQVEPVGRRFGSSTGHRADHAEPFSKELLIYPKAISLGVQGRNAHRARALETKKAKTAVNKRCFNGGLAVWTIGLRRRRQRQVKSRVGAAYRETARSGDLRQRDLRRVRRPAPSANRLLFGWLSEKRVQDVHGLIQALPRRRQRLPRVALE